jgi:hypothetical protein
MSGSVGVAQISLQACLLLVSLLTRAGQLVYPGMFSSFMSDGVLLCTSQVLRSARHPRPNTRIRCIVCKMPASFCYVKMEGHMIKRYTLCFAALFDFVHIGFSFCSYHPGGNL